MARPRAEKPLAATLRVRLTEADIVTLRLAAVSAGTALGPYARHLLEEAIKAEQPKKPRRRKSPKIQSAVVTIQPGQPVRMDVAELHEVRRVGVNLNQLLKYLHTYQVPPPPDLDLLIEQVRRALTPMLARSTRRPPEPG